MPKPSRPQPMIQTRIAPTVPTPTVLLVIDWPIFDYHSPEAERLAWSVAHGAAAELLRQMASAPDVKAPRPELQVNPTADLATFDPKWKGSNVGYRIFLRLEADDADAAGKLSALAKLAIAGVRATLGATRTVGELAALPELIKALKYIGESHEHEGGGTCGEADKPGEDGGVLCFKCVAINALRGAGVSVKS